MADKAKTPDVEATPELPEFFSVNKLLKPIDAHGEKITELKLRMPTAADILSSGVPITFAYGEKGGGWHADENKMADMISRLGGIPPTSVLQLDPRDLVGIIYQLEVFFLLGRLPQSLAKPSSLP